MGDSITKTEAAIASLAVINITLVGGYIHTYKELSNLKLVNKNLEKSIQNEINAIGRLKH